MLKYDSEILCVTFLFETPFAYFGIVTRHTRYRWHFCSLRLIARPRVDHVMDGLDVSCQMFFLDYLYGEFHHYVPFGPSMMIRKPLETSGNRPRRFPADFRIFLLIIFEK